jgi:hypothetical protein
VADPIADAVFETAFDEPSPSDRILNGVNIADLRSGPADDWRC